MSTRLCVLLLTGACLFCACSKKSLPYTSPEDYRGGTFKNSKEIYQGYVTITDTLDKRWAQMLKTDREKFKTSRNILKKAQKFGNYDDTLHTRIISNLEKVENYPYTEEKITNDKYIDEYDSLTNVVLRDIQRLIDQLEPTCHKCNDLYKETGELENLLVAYRISYDQWADVHNWYIEKHRNKLEKEYVSPFDLKPRPLFRIRVK